MNQSNSSKQVLLSVIGVAILVVAVVGVSFAFFNYTRTGAQNTVNTGKINFQSTQSADPVQVSNLFPLTSAPADATNGLTGYDAASANFARILVTITGETTWAAGLDYQISAVQANLTVGDSATPLPLKVHVYEDPGYSKTGVLTTAGNADTFDTTYGTAANLPAASKTVLGTGHIAGTDTYAGNGSRYTRHIIIDAYILADDIAITDTPTESTAWVAGRTRYSTAQWNALSTAGGAKFKILVESSETGGSYVANGNYS